MDVADEEKRAGSVSESGPETEIKIHSPDGQDDDRITTQLSNVESIWPAEHLSTTRQILMVFICCMTQWCTQGAFAQTLTLLHDIGTSFGVEDPSQLGWLVAGYSLTVGTFILFSGRLGDAFGYKRMLIIGLVWFSVWSVICGLSVFSNYVLAVFARVLLGIGPAICLPNALAILGASYPPGHTKAMVFALFGATAPVGAIVSAIIGAAIATVWWPWALWALGLYLAVLAALATVAIPHMPRKDDVFADGFSWSVLADELDPLGAITGVVALVLFNFAWNQAPISGWGTATIIVPLVLGLILFGAFAYVEIKVARKPLLPFDIINGQVAFVLGVVACGWASFGIWILYLTQIIQVVRGISPLLQTVYLIPLPIFGVIAAFVTGKLLGPLQVRPPVVMTMALAAFTIGITLIATLPPFQIYWAQIFVCTIVIPFGMDMSFPAATLILSNAVKKEHQGVAASLVNTVVNYSISLAVGVATTVEVHVSHGDMLNGFRGGLYVGVGLASLGFLVCLVFLARDYLAHRKGAKEDSE